MAQEADETIAGRISRVLAERIIAGALEPGARLRQDHIAAEFGASHVPVREAFRRLEAQGLAASEPRRGVRVAAFSLAEVKEVAEMRAALEVLALRHAAGRHDAALFAQAEFAVQAGDDARDIHVWEEANRRFHRLILAPCRMPRLLAAIDDLHAASARFLFATWRSEWEGQTDRDHRAILAALQRSDIESAADILSRHVRWVGRWQITSQTGTTREAFAITG